MKLLEKHGEAHEEWSIARQELDLLPAEEQTAKMRENVKRLKVKWRAVLKKLVTALAKTNPLLKAWVSHD